MTRVAWHLNDLMVFLAWHGSEDSLINHAVVTDQLYPIIKTRFDPDGSAFFQLTQSTKE